MSAYRRFGRVLVGALSFGLCFCVTTPTYAVNLQMIDGYEHQSQRSMYYQSNLEVVSPTGTVIDTTIVRTGAASVRVTAAPPTIPRYAYGLPNLNELVFRVAVRLDAIPSGDVPGFVYVGPWFAPVAQIGFDSASGNFRADVGGAVQVGSVAVQAGTWHVVEGYAVMNANPHTFQWRIDGIDQSAASHAVAPSTIHTFAVGSTGGLTQAYGANYDDVALSWSGADYPIGNGTVTALRPDGMGTSNAANLLDGDGTAIDASTWQQLDDASFDTLGDHVYQVNTDTAGYVEVTLEDTPATAAANGVRALTATRSGNDSPTNHGSTRVLRAGDTTATSALVQDGDMSDAAGRIVGEMVPPPAAGWTPAEVDALRIRLGFSSDAAPDPFWDAVFVQVDHPAAYPSSGSPPLAPPHVNPGDGSSTADTTPDLLAQFVDPDGSGTGTLTFEVCSVATAAAQDCAAAGGTVAATGTSTAVAEGATATWTVSSALAPGTYHWHARAQDDTSKVGPWSATWQLTITAGGSTAIDVSACTAVALDFGAVVVPDSAATAVDCTIGFSVTGSAGGSRLLVSQQDAIGRAVQGPSVVLDYGEPGGTWAGTSMFGACLRSATSATATWTTTGACNAADGPEWNAVGTAADQVATAADGVTGSAHLRFGLKLAPQAAPGAYAAPISFAVAAVP